MASAIVVDTMIASAWLGVRDSPRKARWAPLLERSPWVLPFTVVAECASEPRLPGGVLADVECSIGS